MSETAQHPTVTEDASEELAKALAALDVRSLSFVQLRRLQKALVAKVNEVALDTKRREQQDAGGDTVRVQSPESAPTVE